MGIKEFIWADKKKKTMYYDMPGLGTAEIRNDPSSQEISAVVRHGDKEEKIGFLKYHMEDGKFKIVEMFTKEPYRKNDLALVMTARLGPPDRVVHRNVVDPHGTPYKIADALLQRVENDKKIRIKGLGDVVIRNTYLGNSGEVNAVLTNNGRKQPVGWMQYNIVRKGSGVDNDQVRISYINVNEGFEGNKIGRKMYDFLESNFKGKDFAILDMKNFGALKFANRKKHVIQRDSELGMWSLKKAKPFSGKPRKPLR
jgi:hypothetical protein